MFLHNEHLVERELNYRRLDIRRDVAAHAPLSGAAAEWRSRLACQARRVLFAVGRALVEAGWRMEQRFAPAC